MTHPPNRPHILVMNDSPDVMALFDDLLTEEGYRVTTMPFLEKDLDKIVAYAPDGIILDYMWPQEDSGWSLLQMLKMDPRTKSLPIVLCTGAVQHVQALQVHLNKMGIRVVLKPFDLEQLLSTLTDALGSADGFVDNELQGAALTRMGGTYTDA